MKQEINKRPEDLTEAITMLQVMWDMKYHKIPYKSLDEALDAYSEDETKFFSKVAYAGITCHFINLPSPFEKFQQMTAMNRMRWEDVDFNNMDEDEKQED